MSGASSVMMALSTSHLLIVVMVVVGNVAYFIGRKTVKRAN
jgi:hypothetical protein